MQEAGVLSRKTYWKDVNLENLLRDARNKRKPRRGLNVIELEKGMEQDGKS
jgi:hypothetical protein